MAKKFKIYFKNGRIIELELTRFTLENQKLALYDKYNEEVENLFISFDEVAAVIPNELPQTESLERFQVYLRKQKEPIEITAYKFKINELSEIIFKSINYSNHRFPIENLYIALSEVLAILPAEKLSVSSVGDFSDVSNL